MVDKTSQQTADRIIDEHRRVRAMLVELEQSAGVHGALAALDELAPLLKVHFVTEEQEQEGLHRVIADRAPWQSARLDALFEEHRQLLEMVTGLRAKAGELGADGNYAELAPAVVEFLNALRKHEAAETELLSDTMTTDYGAGE